MTDGNAILDLNRLMDDIKDVIAERLEETSHSATGNGIKSLEVSVEDDSGNVQGNFYLDYLQEGVKPRWIPWYALRDWAKSRGIITDDSYESRAIVGAIRKKIISEGTVSYRNGGEDIYSGSVVDLVDNHIQDYLDIDNNINLNNF